VYFVTVVNEGLGYSHVAYTCLLLGLIISAKYSMPHFHHIEHINYSSAKYSMPHFHHNEHTTYSLLMLLSWGHFRQKETLLHKMVG